jgi:aryl carrier-like protein
MKQILVFNYKKEFKSKPSWTPNTESIQKIIHESIVSRNKPFGTASDSLISFGWNSIELLSLGNELNLKGVYVPLTSFIQHPTIEFILNLASEDLKNDCLENPTAEDFDIDDILSILND